VASRVLLTGFTQFGPHAANPSEEIVRRIGAAPPRGVALATLVLPVEYRTAFGPVRDVLDREEVDAVLHVGLAAARTSVEVERFALNWRGGAQADESGLVLDGEPVDPAGPAAYLSSLPVGDLVAAIRAAGAPCGASSHAGTFLCNQVLYQTLRHADTHGRGVRAAFIHVPEPGPDGGRPDVATLVRGIEAAVRCAAALPRRRRPRAQTVPTAASRRP
jgi:pyroglutamyl-peptidase